MERKAFWSRGLSTALVVVVSQSFSKLFLFFCFLLFLQVAPFHRVTQWWCCPHTGCAGQEVGSPVLPRRERFRAAALEVAFLNKFVEWQLEGLSVVSYFVLENSCLQKNSRKSEFLWIDLCNFIFILKFSTPYHQQNFSLNILKIFQYLKIKIVLSYSNVLW